MLKTGCTLMLIFGFAMMGCDQGPSPSQVMAAAAPGEGDAAAKKKSPDADSKSDTGGDAKADDDAKNDKADKPQLKTVVIAGGCFWCVEAVFEELEGVKEAVSGYSGGKKETANYKAVCSGLTKHAEAVQITYDPKKISYEKLLAVHFATHDPTQLNRQGNDFGPQYRSAIFYASEDEKKAAAAMIDRLNESGVFPKKIVTTLEPLEAFYVAEAYHQDFVCNNPNQGYVQAVAMPKVEKVRKHFKDDLKKDKDEKGDEEK